MFGKLAIISTALFTSLSSTVLLAGVTHPYVISIHELPSDTNKEIPERRFLAKRVTIFGREKATEFLLSDVDNRNVAHPYASFKLKSNNNSFYVFGPLLKDESIRNILSKD